jgi:hypothetical protein
MRRVALFITLAGCSNILGFKEVTLGDAGGDSGSQIAPPNTVIGRAHSLCHQPSGDIDGAVDLSPAIVQALIPDTTTGGHRTVDGVGKADGTFTINDVPDGVRYMFRIGPNYYETDQHVIDYYFETTRRCTPAPGLAGAATSLSLDLTGMTPLTGGSSAFDQVLILPFTLGSVLSSSFLTDAGATAVHTTVNVPSGFPLVDASAGDDLFVFHLRSGETVVDPASKRRRFASYLVDSFEATGVTMQSGTSTPISGVFQPVMMDKPLSFSIDRSQLDVGYDGTSDPAGPIVAVLATPLLSTPPLGVPLAQLDMSDISRSTSLRQTVTNYMYGDPFPATWKRFTSVSYFRTRSFKHPAATQINSIAALSQEQSEYTGVINTSPRLQPPSGVKIRGIDFTAGGKLAFDGVKPVVVTWNPVLSAKAYRVVVYSITTTVITQLATLRTTDTSITIPAQLFNGGQFFAFTLAAVRTPRGFDPGQVFPMGLPLEVADLPSGMFRFSKDCGDGVVKPGEEDCDSSGETSSCDVDCTKPACGDGLRNAAAGEACDTVVDTPGCDSDCTLPVCGDGHTNLALEDCDDGNAIDDGNGCGIGCKFNNVCGNGRREAAAEDCDPGTAGDTATCDSDCTLPQCGDGHLNTLAGEQCDNGPKNGTGHCSVTCKLQ